MIKKKFAIVGMITAIGIIIILSYLLGSNSPDATSITDKKFRVYDSPELMWIETVRLMEYLNPVLSKFLCENTVLDTVFSLPHFYA